MGLHQGWGSHVWSWANPWEQCRQCRVSVTEGKARRAADSNRGGHKTNISCTKAENGTETWGSCWEVTRGLHRSLTHAFKWRPWSKPKHFCFSLACGCTSTAQVSPKCPSWDRERRREREREENDWVGEKSEWESKKKEQDGEEEEKSLI